MKELRVARNAGFCFGVRRAVDAVLAEAAKGCRLLTYGELIHNENVVGRLEQIGVGIVESPEEVPPDPLLTVAIRSHGVPQYIEEALRSRGVHVLDLTCPFVKRIHQKVSASDRPVYVVGTPEHPEVIGVQGWARGPCTVVPSPLEAARVPVCDQALAVAQTTIPLRLWEDTTHVLAQRCGDLELFPSICDTTRKRQTEAAELAETCDLIVVIGGRHSSNTAKLAHICQERCEHVLRIAEAGELSLENVKSHAIIGIIAGASTPDWLIREVQARMSEMENVQETVITDEDASSAEPVATEPEVTVEEAAEEVAETAGDETPAAVEAEVKTEVEPAEAVAVTEAVASAADSDEDDDDSLQGEDADFMAEIEKSLVSIRRGQIVTGTVVQVSDNEVCVNIGYKSDGILPKENLSTNGDINPKDAFHEGDEIEAEIVTLNDGEGNVLLSRKSIESKLKWKELLDSLEEGQVYTVKVDKVVKGGVLAKLEGYDAFIPASHLSLKYVEDLTQFVGQDLDVEIIEADKRQRRFVLSHKKVLEKQRAEEEARLYQSFHKGDKVVGKVKRLTDFGAFVDIGGVDGLLHVTDIAWTKVKHPSDVLNVGDDIEILILNVDPERKRISLGLKQLQPKPWDLVPQKYIVGDTVEGTVVRIMPFGAFVSLEPTIDGLIHISQVTNRRLEKVEDELRIGDKVTAKIMEVNPAKKRISLSLRALMDEPSRPPRGDRGGRGDSRRRGDDYDDRSYSYKLPPVESVTVSLADEFRRAEEAKEEE